MRIFSDQRGVIQIPFIIFLLAAIVIGVYLVQKQTNLSPKASEGRNFPKASCQPRPACLDSSPACLLPMPAEGWCHGSSPTPLPTTNSCAPVKSYTPLVPCGKDMYKSATYVCADGTRGQIGYSSWKNMSNSCKPLADLKQDIANKCKQGHDVCPAPSESVVPLPRINPDGR